MKIGRWSLALAACVCSSVAASTVDAALYVEYYRDNLFLGLAYHRVGCLTDWNTIQANQDYDGFTNQRYCFQGATAASVPNASWYAWSFATVETLSACLLAEARMHATDPAILRALGRMLRDEERHSALAWRTLRWALSVDPTVAPAAREALDRAIAALTTEGFSHEADLSRFGVLRPADARACLQTAIREVIVPCRDAIFGEGDERRA